MPHLEPTYLRYIYDGLLKGSIHPENSAELPDGLIGLYEEAFDERTSVIERQKLLHRFAIWALLKKEVSAAFVAEVLGETEDDIQEFISTYSAWFNSPESGKYQLYHERLKVYLLQKLSEQELQVLHEQLISRLEQAIEEQKADEFEWYGLEYLGGHYTVQSKTTKDVKDAEYTFNFFYEFQFSKTIITRQQKLSNSYKWSKINLKLLSELGIIFKSKKVLNISDLACEIHKEEYDIIEKLEKLLSEGNYDQAINLVTELQGAELELIELKIYHLLFLLIACDDDNSFKNVILILEDLLSKHAGELFYVENLIPSCLILSICIKIKSFEVSSDFIIDSCDNWKEDYYSPSAGNLDPLFNMDERIKGLVNRKIKSVKTSADFVTDRLFSKDQVEQILSLGLSSIKMEIKARNNAFHSFKGKFEKSNQLFNYDNPEQTLEFTESSQNYIDEAELFYFLISNKEEFTYTSAHSLLRCFKSFKYQNLKDLVIDKFWGILIVDLDLIDWIFDISNTVTLKKLSSINSNILNEILSISQSPKLIDACKTIIDIRSRKNPSEFFNTTFCCSFDSSFEFKFSCLETTLNPEQMKHFYQLKYHYFKELFDSNIETDILNFNIPIVQELVAFCTFCKKNYIELFDELITSFVNNIGQYDKWQSDENLFFLIDEMNKKNLSVEAYKILDMMKTPLIQKVTLMKSFANWAFFNHMSVSFKNENLSFIRNEHRQFVILGWLKDGYGSMSFDLNVGNELPFVPDSLIDQSVFLENQLFLIDRPDILKIFALKIINQENKPETMRSYFPFILSTQENSIYLDGDN